MLKKLMLSAATAALIAGSAGAQAPTTPPASTPPAAQESGKAQVVTQQTADQMLASKFKGTNVIGSGDEKIGDVSDILFDKEGKVLAYVVGVGGFLGIGSKDVAIAPASFQVQPATDRESMKLKLSMTKDELKNAAEFKPRSDSGSATTGMGQRDRAPATPPAR